MKTLTSMLSFGVGLLPALAFTLHDLVFQLPDNQHEASLGFFASIVALLLVWGIGGYLAARGTGTIFSAVRAGAMAGATSVFILWLTFFTLNRLFPDRMSYEPDRIRAFKASGYSTMREYLNHEVSLGPFPLLMGVAALAGVAGGVMGKHQATRRFAR